MKGRFSTLKALAGALFVLPLLVALTLEARPRASRAQSKMPSQRNVCPTPVNNTVGAIAIRSDIYAGGAFTDSGVNANADGIAKFRP